MLGVGKATLGVAVAIADHLGVRHQLLELRILRPFLDANAMADPQTDTYNDWLKE